MSYPNVSINPSLTEEMGRKLYADKIAEIHKFINENHRDQFGNLTNEFHSVIESLGYEYFGEDK